MNEDMVCKECGSRDWLYRKIYKEVPMWLRIFSFCFAIFILGCSIYVARSTSEPIFPFVGFLFSIFILWAHVSGRMKEQLTSLRFKCVECGHQYDVEKSGVGHTKKWKEKPPAKWHKVVHDMDINKLRG